MFFATKKIFFAAAVIGTLLTGSAAWAEPEIPDDAHPVVEDKATVEKTETKPAAEKKDASSVSEESAPAEWQWDNSPNAAGCRIRIREFKDFNGPVANDLSEPMIRPRIDFVKIVDADTLPNTPRGALEKFIIYGNARSCQVWSVLNSSSRGYIADLMVKSWREQNKDSAADLSQIKAMMIEYFQSGGNVASVFWKVYFDEIFGTEEFMADTDTSNFKISGNTAQANLGGDIVYLVCEQGEWKVDIVKSDLHKLHSSGVNL